MPQLTTNNRIWEIDFFRGIALILMIFFHIIWDLNEYYHYPLDYSSGIFFVIGKTAAFLFIIITGISCIFSSNNPSRGIKIFAVAMVVTIVTYFYDPDSFIIFGILHFLGINVLLYPYYNKLNNSLLLLLGTMIILLGQAFQNVDIDHNYLLVLGLARPDYYPLDYYPLLPYTGLFLLGIVLSRILYPKKQSLFRFNFDRNPISTVGKNTLLVYLLHQPIILAILYLLSMIGLI